MHRHLYLPRRLRWIDEPPASDGGTGAGTPPATDPTPSDDGEQDPPGAEALGDPGKRALDAMKRERNEAKAETKALRDQLAAMQAKIDGTEAEHAAAQEHQRIEAEALARANRRILSAEIRAAAAGRLSDPDDALLYLDLDDYEVSDDGEVDRAAIATALETLVTNKPYLAAQGGAASPKPDYSQGVGEQGATTNAQRFAASMTAAGL